MFLKLFYIKQVNAFKDLLYWLCHIIWLIFDGKILRNTVHFVRLQTAEGMRPHNNACLSCIFLVKPSKRILT